MVSLQDMPQEIHSQILDQLIQEENKTAFPCLSRYAAVSNTFKSVMEERTFRNLTLTPKDIREFEMNVDKTRQPLVKHIIFKVETKDGAPNGGSFSTAIIRLLQDLSTWKTEGPNSNGGLTLELGAFSSYERRWGSLSKFSTTQYSTFLNDQSCFPEKTTPYEPDPFISKLKKCDRDSTSNPPRNMSGDKLRMSLLLGNEELKMFGSMGAKLEVPVVTKLLIRLRHMRNFHPVALARIISCLPCLDEVQMERWRFGNPTLDDSWSKRADKIFKPLLPSNFGPEHHLKRLSLYDECSTAFHRQKARIAWLPAADGSYGYRPHLVRSILHASVQLEQLSVAFTIPAEEFLNFGLFYPSHCAAQTVEDGWPRLRELALTSALVLAADPAALNSLLSVAARQAMRMPALETLELWFCKAVGTRVGREQGSAMGVFRYSCKPGADRRDEDPKRAVAMWFGSLDFQMSREVVDLWQAVADQKQWRDYRMGARRCGVRGKLGQEDREEWMMYHRQTIQAYSSQMEWRGKKGPGDVIDLLELKDLVLHELSRDLVRA